MGEGDVVVAAYDDDTVGGEVDKGVGVQLNQVHPDLADLFQDTPEVVDHPAQVPFGFGAGGVKNGDR